MKKKSSSPASSLAVLLAAGALIGGGAYYYTVYNAPAAVPQSEDAQAAQESAKAPAPSLLTPKEEQIREKFYSYLDGFIKDVDVQMDTYKNKRKAVRDMVRPENMLEFAYVTENKMVAEEIMGGMSTQMDMIVVSFEKADSDIKSYLRGTEFDGSHELLAQWEQTKDGYLDGFLQFFAIEKDILGIYRKIFEVYERSAGQYQVNIEQGSVTFAEPGLQGVYDEYMARVASLQEEEARVLGQQKAPAQPVPPAVSEGGAHDLTGGAEGLPAVGEPVSPDVDASPEGVPPQQDEAVTPPPSTESAVENPQVTE